MKHLITYNESIRDKMTPKDQKEIRKNLKNVSPDHMFGVGCRENLPWLVKLALKKGANPDCKVHLWNPMDFTVTNEDIPHESWIRYLNDEGRTEIIELIHDHMKTNEGVRDKMTPKSGEEIDKIVYELLHQYPLLGIFDWKKFGWTFNYKLINAVKDDSYFFEDKKGHSIVLNLYDGKRIDLRPNAYNDMIKIRFNNFKELEDYLTTLNEGVRDMMTPISKEEVVDKLRITLNKVLKRSIADCKEEGFTRPMDIGQTAVSYTTDEIPIAQVFDEGTDRMGMGTLTLNPFIKEVMEELLVKYFPKWNEKNIKSFWIGFEEEKEIMYFG